MNRLLQTRTNVQLCVNYENNGVAPTAEVVFIVASPKYDIDVDGKILKNTHVSDLRFHASAEFLEHAIKELTAVMVLMEQFKNTEHD